jgi:hypothetical protein
MSDSLPRDQEPAEVLFLRQAEHKEFDYFFAFRPEILSSFVGLSMRRWPVRVFLFERQMTLDRAGELTTCLWTIFDAVNSTFFSRVAVKIKNR